MNLDIDDILACPACRGMVQSADHIGFSCESCGATYHVRDEVTVFMRADSKVIADESGRAEFWDAGWEKRNAHLLSMNRNEIFMERLRYLDYLAKEGYPSAVDISTDSVAGKTFLNVGCGGGYEGLLFAGYGARYIGVDFSHNAANFTKIIIDKAGYNSITYQAEAEALPFKSNSIDYLYSSGVLHHTPNIEQSLKEVHRVLKPGGTAMIGLYATYSVMFIWYRLRAVLSGNFSKKAVDSWMNANTEGDWQTESRENHWTKTYTKAAFSGLMKQAGFRNCQIKQTPQQIKTIPLLGKVIGTLLPAAIGDLRVGPFGGMLVMTCVKNQEPEGMD
jgi:ubiquinone/menaquinone biosynthesis C-methylase UbiE/uncharacterized protein YbaR (Trm112 family)